MWYQKKGEGYVEESLADIFGDDLECSLGGLESSVAYEAFEVAWDFLEDGDEVSWSGVWAWSEVGPDPGGSPGGAMEEAVSREVVS